MTSTAVAVSDGERGCATFELDSGVQRHGAHRFYLRHRMRITAHQFVLDL